LQVNWQTVLWGICLQFIFAVIVLRWFAGFVAFKWLGDRVTELITYSDFGAQFVFGDSFRDHFLAFQASHPCTSMIVYKYLKSHTVTDSHTIRYDTIGLTCTKGHTLKLQKPRCIWDSRNSSYTRGVRTLEEFGSRNGGCS